MTRTLLQYGLGRGGLHLICLLAFASGVAQARLVIKSCEPHIQFQEYVPSKWETTWLTQAAKLEQNVCQQMEKDGDLAQTWLNTLQQAKVGADAAAKVVWDPNVFSKFVYKNPCKPHGPVTNMYIEPVVGMVRHPYAACTQTVEIEDRSYIVLSGLSGFTLSQMYPGRKYLFDLGTREFASSVDWFTKAYQAVGIEFDEIFAWELRAQDPTTYWASVPAPMKQKLHFYNIGVDTNLTSPDHPLSMIRSLYKPGDLVVVKLDIDHEEMETQMLKTIADDPQLVHAIGDLFHEPHYDHPVIRPWFVIDLKQKLPDVFKFFNTFRSKGMRLHPWP